MTFIWVPDIEKPARAIPAMVTPLTELCLVPELVVLNVLPSLTLALSGPHPGEAPLPAISQHKGTSIPVPLGKNPFTLNEAAISQVLQPLASWSVMLLLRLLKFLSTQCLAVPMSFRLESRMPRPVPVVYFFPPPRLRSWSLPI